MSQVRFLIGDEIISEWEEETVKSGNQHTAVVRMAQLRAQYPEGAIRVERRGHSLTPNPIQRTRFRITNTGVKDEVGFSAWLLPNQVERALKQIKERYPKADITTEIRNG